MLRDSLERLHPAEAPPPCPGCGRRDARVLPPRGVEGMLEFFGVHPYHCTHCDRRFRG